MLTQGNVRNVLETFKNYVINQSRAFLTRKGKNVTGNLYNSIKGDVKVYKNSMKVTFDLGEYGVYQDKGVSGTQRKYKTPFSYTDKAPPPQSLEKWISAKRFQFRNEKGQFMSYKSMSYIIARSIFKKGIKPSLFFTKPFENAYKTLPDDLVEAYGLDLEDFLAFTLNNERLR